MSNKNIYDEALARAIDSCMNIEDQDILTNSYCSSTFPGEAMLLIATEKAIMAKIGIPEGWSEPLSPNKELFKLWVLSYLRNTPSINERRSKGNRDMIASASQRAPAFNNAMTFDQPYKTSLQNKAEAK